MISAQDCLEIIRRELTQAAIAYNPPNKTFIQRGSELFATKSKESIKLADNLAKASGNASDADTTEDVVKRQLHALCESMASHLDDKRVSLEGQFSIDGNFAQNHLRPGLGAIHAQISVCKDVPELALTQVKSCLLVLSYAEEMSIYNQTSIIGLMRSYLNHGHTTRFSSLIEHDCYRADNHLLPTLVYAIQKNLKECAWQIYQKIRNNIKEPHQRLSQVRSEQGYNLFQQAVIAEHKELISDFLRLGLSPEDGGKDSALIYAIKKPVILKKILRHPYYRPDEGLTLLLAEVMKYRITEALPLVLDCIEKHHKNTLKKRFIDNEFLTSGNETALHLAVKAGDRRLVLKLLNMGSDPRHVDLSGQTCLDVAMKSNNPHMVVTVIEHPNFKPPKNLSALFKRCLFNKQYALCEKILQYKVSTESTSGTITKEELNIIFLDALKQGDQSAMQFLLSNGINANDKFTALRMAIDANDLSLIIQLMEDAKTLPTNIIDACVLHASHSEDDEHFYKVMRLAVQSDSKWSINNCRDKQGSLLHHAVVKEKSLRLELLLSSNTKDSLDSMGQSALSLALLQVKTTNFKNLLSAVNALTTDSFVSALQVAVASNKVDIVVRLLDAAREASLPISIAELLNQYPATGQPLLTVAIKNQYAFMAEYIKSQGAALPEDLISDFQALQESPKDYPLQGFVSEEDTDALDRYINWGASPERVNSAGRSALSLAIRDGKMTVFKRILEHPNYTVSENIFAVIYQAIQSKNIEALDLLIAKVKSRNGELNLVDILNQFHPSKEIAHLLSLAVSLKQEKVVYQLLLCGVSLDKQRDSNFALRLSLSTYQNSIFYFMLNHESYIPRKNILDVMRFAVEQNNHDALIALIEKASQAGLLNENNKLLSQVIYPKSGDTLLHLAVKEKNAFLLDILVKHGADLDIENNTGITARNLGYYYVIGERTKYTLHDVAEKGESEQLLRYIRHGGCPFRVNKDLQSALSILIWKKHRQLLKSALELVTEIDQHDLAVVVTFASYHKDVDAIQQLLHRYQAIYSTSANLSRPYTVSGITGITAIHHAIEQGNEEMLSLLLAHGASSTHQNKQGESALAYAARLKQWSLMDILLGRELSEESGLGLALVFATKHDNESMVFKLLDKAEQCGLMDKLCRDIDTTKIREKKNKYSALVCAINSHNVFLAELLLSLGANPIHCVFKAGSFESWRQQPKKYSLHRWVEEDSREQVLDYMRRGASPDKITSDGVSALSLAINQGKFALALAIVDSADYQASPGIVVAINEAIKCKQVALLTRLLDKGRQLKSTHPGWLNQSISSSHSPLYLAVEYDRVDMLDALLALGADPLHEDIGKFSAMSLAISSDDQAAINKLLPHIYNDADKLIQTLLIAAKYGETPLMIELLHRLKTMIEDTQKLSQRLNDSVDAEGNNLLHLTRIANNHSMQGLLMYLGMSGRHRNHVGELACPASSTASDKGNSILLEYAKAGDTGKVQKLMQLGVSLDTAMNKEEGSSLMVLIKNHRDKDLLQLIKMDSYRPTKNIIYAIRLAAKYNETELFSALIDKIGSDTKLLRELTQLGNPSTNTTVIHHALAHDNAVMVNRLLDCGTEISQSPKKGISPLRFAIVNCKTQAINAMLTHGKTQLSNAMVDDLHWALTQHDLDTANLILNLAESQARSAAKLLSPMTSLISNDSCLHLAVKAYDANLSLRLIRLGASLVSKNHQGETALQLIIEYAMDTVIEALIADHKICSDEVLIRALMYFIKENQSKYLLPCMALARERGLLDMKQEWIELLCKNEHGCSLLALCERSGLDSAAKILRQLGFEHSSRSTIVNSRECEQTSTLQTAVQDANLTLMQQMLVLGEDPLEGSPSALELARKSDNAEVFKTLISHPRFTLSQQSFNQLVLSLVSSGESHHLGCLLERYTKAALHDTSSPALAQSTLSTHDLILSAGVPDHSSMNMSIFKQALIDAVQQGATQMVSILIAYGADPLAKDTNNHTAICHALIHSNPSVIDCLLEHINRVDERIMYPITVADCIGNYTQRDRLIQRYLQSAEQQTASITYTLDNNPYHLAIDANQPDSVANLLQAQVSAEITPHPPQQVCALTYARRKWPELFQYMLNHPDYHPSEALGQAFLDAVEDGDYAAVRLLLAKTEELNSTLKREQLINGAYRDDNRDRALHIAVRNGDKEMVQLLLQQGAKPDLANLHCKTAKDLAEDAHHAHLFTQPPLVSTISTSSHQGEDISQSSSGQLRYGLFSSYSSIPYIEQFNRPVQLAPVTPQTSYHTAAISGQYQQSQMPASAVYATATVHQAPNGLGVPLPYHSSYIHSYESYGSADDQYPTVTPTYTSSAMPYPSIGTTPQSSPMPPVNPYATASLGQNTHVLRGGTPYQSYRPPLTTEAYRHLHNHGFYAATATIGGGQENSGQQPDPAPYMEQGSQYGGASREMLNPACVSHAFYQTAEMPHGAPVISPSAFASAPSEGVKSTHQSSLGGSQ